MEQRLAPTVVHLIVDGGEVGVILLARVANIDDGEPSLIKRRGHEPILVAGYKQAHIVLYLDRLLGFEFNKVALTCDQVSQLAFGGVVAGPEALVGVEQQAAHEM